MTSRPLIIPQKRPLLSIRRKEIIKDKSAKTVPKVINPSAVAAHVRLRKTLPYNPFPDADEPGHPYSKPEPIEWNLVPHAPFLDPAIREALRQLAKEKRKAREDEARSVAETNGGTETNGGDPGPSETPDQRRQRLDREAEYGSMAIRDRSNLRGRGRRPRGRGGGRGRGRGGSGTR